MKPIRVVGLLLIYLFLSTAGSSRTDEMIDSLAVIEDPRTKLGLAIEIADSFQFNDWRRTLYYLDVASKMAEEVGTDEAICEYNFGAASIYQTNGLFDLALDHYHEAYTHFDPKQSNIDKYRIENNLGILYARRGNIQKALHFFNLVLNAEGLEQISKAQILNNIGNFLIESSTPDSALLYLNRAEAIVKTMSDRELIALVATNQARAYALMSDNLSADRYFNFALTLAKDGLSNEVKSWVYLSITNEYASRHIPDSTIKYAGLALEVLEDRPRDDYLQHAAHAMFTAYIEKGDYKRATDYFQMYDTAKNEQIVQQKDISIDRLKLVHEFEAELRKKNLEDSQQRHQLIIIGLIILSALILMGGLILRFRAKLHQANLEIELIESKRKELQAKLELKEKKLVSETMVELTKKSMSDSVVEKLKKIKRNARKAETRNEVDQLINQIIREQRTDIWKEFDTHFTEIHETFYKQLHEQHEGLTSKDMRLCALLKINLTTKEIAELAGQSTKGVENARVRLRRKLNLTNTGSDLTAYLNSLT